jgi:transglutaminase-like putative cysteine protease
MKFSVGSELTYTAIRDTTLVLNMEVQRIPGQQLFKEEFTVTPQTPSESHELGDTKNRYRRLHLSPGRYTMRYAAEVETQPVVNPPRDVGEVSVSQLPLDVMNYLFPSRYCPSDQLGRFAWRRFGDLPAGHSKVDAICDWIHDNVDYLEGSSDASTSAHDTFTTRSGVCRDFAHLGIAICRALGIPARFVSAYGWKLEPQDFHAVFEAYLAGRWYLFDPTRLSPPEGVIRIGVGRDAADTAFATWFGQLDSEPKKVWVDEAGRVEEVPEQAVSISAT